MTGGKARLVQTGPYHQQDVLHHTGVAGQDHVDPWNPRVQTPADIQIDYTVGPGPRFETVQSAIDFVVRIGATRRVVIGVCAGLHKGLIYVPATSFPITLVGLGKRPEDTVLADAIDAEMPGAEYAGNFARNFAGSPPEITRIFERIAQRPKIETANASLLRIESDDFELLNLTVRNIYNADRPQPDSQQMNAHGQYTSGQHQAVAVLVAGADRVHLQDLRLRSFQDTLYLQSPRKGETVRTNLVNCDIEGDVDFIFGQSTAWFERYTIRSLGSRSAQSWAIAPSTDIRTRFGFVFHDCDFVDDGTAPAGAMWLGRQWFEGVRATPFGQADITGYRCDLGPVSSFTPPVGTISLASLNSVGKCVVQNSRIGAHINRGAHWNVWGAKPWSLRYRPALYSLADLQFHLGDWLASQGLSFDDLPAETPFLELLLNREL